MREKCACKIGKDSIIIKSKTTAYIRNSAFMIRIAIVEDEAAYAAQLQDFLLRYAQERNEVFDISVFSDGDEILEGYKAKYDLILLDVEMKFMDGMTTAEEIRKVDPEVVIIFITNMVQYAVRGYAVDAMDYIVKPVSYFAFSQRLNRAISRMEKRARRYMAITIKGGTQKLDIDQIYYIESQGHNLIFYTAQGEHISTGTMKDAEEKLESLGFFRCNKGYLVNLAHVEAVRNGCAVINGIELLISRARKNDFMEALADYMGEVIK